MQPKYKLTSMCDQNCGVQGVKRHTERKVQTEEPKILSIFSLQTEIIGSPKYDKYRGRIGY